MRPEVANFLEVQVAECGAAPNTIAAYTKDLALLDDFLTQRNIDLIFAKNQDLRDYLTWIKDQGYSIRTQSRRMSSMREFYRFLFSENIIKKNPTDYLDAPKTQKSLPKYLSEQEILDLIQNAPKINRRMQPLLEVLYASGMRVSELVSLPLTAITREKKRIYVIGKGSKERIVPLNDEACEALDTWLTVRQILYPRADKTKWSFPAK